MTDVVVVGGGVTGLVAARDLAAAGARVTLLEPGRLGGKLQTTAFAGGSLDEAADAFLARVPEGVDLCRELGLAGDLVSPARRNAHVWSHGRLRPLPASHVLGIPTDLDELAASGVVSAEGVAAAGRDGTEPLVAPDGDVTIGALIRARLGDEIADRLVDPLVGGINAGDTDQLSLAATVPQIDAAARSGAPSLIEACREQRSRIADPDAPVFFAPRGGMGALTDALVADLDRLGVDVAAVPAGTLAPEGARWRIGAGGTTDPITAIVSDHVIVTTPAPVAAGLLRDVAPRSATLLSAIPYASVALVAIAVDAAGIDRELDASGFLVPRVEGRLVSACSWTSAKWDHLVSGGRVWLRASVGRDGDDRFARMDDPELTAAVLADLRDTMALRGHPEAVRVTRWMHSFPQYRTGHLDRVEAIEQDLAKSTPGLSIAGAAYRGLGVPACIRQGRGAAAAVLGGHAAR